MGTLTVVLSLYLLPISLNLGSPWFSSATGQFIVGVVARATVWWWISRSSHGQHSPRDAALTASQPFATASRTSLASARQCVRKPRLVILSGLSLSSISAVGSAHSMLSHKITQTRPKTFLARFSKCIWCAANAI